MKTFDINELLSQVTFPVAEKEVMVEGKVAPRFKAIYRQDTGEVLSVMKKDYVLIPHEVALRPLVEGLADEGWKFQGVNQERSGAKILAVAVSNQMFELNDPLLQRPDQLSPRLVLRNSYDGSTGIEMRLGFFRIACANGMVIGTGRELSVKHNHMGNVKRELENVGTSISQIRKLVPDLEKTISEYKRWLNFDVPEVQAAKVVEETFGKRLVKEILGRRKEKNAWELYNSGTYQLTHVAETQQSGREVKNRQFADAIRQMVSQN